MKSLLIITAILLGLWMFPFKETIAVLVGVVFFGSIFKMRKV